MFPQPCRLIALALLLAFADGSTTSLHAADGTPPLDMRLADGRKQEVDRLMQMFGRLMDEGEFEAAAKTAQRAKQIAPRSPLANAAVQISRMRRMGTPWKPMAGD